MKVQELIEKLQKINPEAHVYVNSDGVMPLDDVLETWDDSDEGRAAMRRGDTWWECWLIAERDKNVT